jgi:pimeloyl-ACP methyl ester carboxylesterase
VTIDVRRQAVLLALGACVAALAAGGCARASTAARLPLAPCHLDGLPQDVLCGTYEVFEDRAAGAERRLAIQVSVLPALRRTAEPDPLFILAGGPGQGARSYAGLAAGAFRDVRRARDIVLVDLRGTGGSHPLACDPPADDLHMLLAQAAALDPARCLEALDADPRFYTTAHAVADLDEVRAALGYERINLWGGSFGTRTALVYVRQFPGRVQAVVLDGAAPFELRFPLWTAADAQRALDLLIADCAGDDACRRAFPELRRDLDALFRTLDERPASVELRHPRTGAFERVVVGRDAVAAALRLFLYLPSHARLVPAVVAEASRGRFEPMAALLMEGFAWSTDTMALGLTLSVICSEDLLRIAPSDIAPAVEQTFLGRSQLDEWSRLCRGWPRGTLPPDLDRPVVLPVPALVLSGALDPVTPPRWGDVMAGHFAHSLHVIVPRAGHNASFTGCVPDLIAEFLRAGSAGDLDASCAASTNRPPFVVRMQGSEP